MKMAGESWGVSTKKSIAPDFRTTERQEVVLFISLYRHRKKGNLLSLGQEITR